MTAPAPLRVRLGPCHRASGTRGLGLGADDRQPSRSVSASVRPAPRFAQRLYGKDMTHLRGWCADDWCLYRVCVQRIGPDGEPIGDDSRMHCGASNRVETIGAKSRPVSLARCCPMSARRNALTEEGA